VISTERDSLSVVMAGRDPAIQRTMLLPGQWKSSLDARNKSGHDDKRKPTENLYFFSIFQKNGTGELITPSTLLR
jgi:hypothetical protein